jgi:hypothetical protein
MPKVLFLAGSLLFAALGLAHAALTLRDLRTPRSFVPTDDSVRVAMAGAPLRLAPQTTIWKAWVGFNLSHSLGLVIFGALLAALAEDDFTFVARSGFVKTASVVVSVLYFWMAVRFWFWVPAAVSAAGAACFVLAALGT